MQVYLVAGLFFAIAVALFAVQNATRVDITLLFWELRGISLVVVILGSALIGALIAVLFGIVKQVKLKRTLKSLNNQIHQQNQEIELLRLRQNRKTDE